MTITMTVPRKTTVSTGGQVERIGSQLRARISERQPKDHADQNEAE
jgi:hypothetical protein